MVQAWVRFAADAEIRARCVFVEDYDLTLARELVQGVDVWINTPRRPWEACGTSGMKVLVNGGLNLSVLALVGGGTFTPDGRCSGAPDSPDGDARDAAELFRILEDQVMPAFYDRDAEGVSRRWLARVRASLSRLTPLFSANRMLGEYVARGYRPAEDDLSARSANDAQAARAIAAWADRLSKNWKTLRFGRLETEETEQGIAIGIEGVLRRAVPGRCGGPALCGRGGEGPDDQRRHLAGDHQRIPVPRGSYHRGTRPRPLHAPPRPPRWRWPPFPKSCRSSPGITESAFAVQDPHLVLVVAGARDRGRRDRLLDTGQVGRREDQRERAQRLLELGPRPRPDQGHDGLPLRQDPGDGELGRTGPFFGGELLQRIDEPLVPFPVLAGEARQVRAEVTLRGRLGTTLSRPRDSTP